MATRCMRILKFRPLAPWFPCTPWRFRFLSFHEPRVSAPLHRIAISTRRASSGVPEPVTDLGGSMTM